MSGVKDMLIERILQYSQTYQRDKQCDKDASIRIDTNDSDFYKYTFEYATHVQTKRMIFTWDLLKICSKMVKICPPIQTFFPLKNKN